MWDTLNGAAKLGDGGFALGQPGQERPPGRVGERPEHEAEPVIGHI